MRKKDPAGQVDLVASINAAEHERDERHDGEDSSDEE